MLLMAQFLNLDDVFVINAFDIYLLFIMFLKIVVMSNEQTEMLF